MAVMFSPSALSLSKRQNDHSYNFRMIVQVLFYFSAFSYRCQIETTLVYLIHKTLQSGGHPFTQSQEPSRLSQLVMLLRSCTIGAFVNHTEYDLTLLI